LNTKALPSLKYESRFSVPVPQDPVRPESHMGGRQRSMSSSGALLHDLTTFAKNSDHIRSSFSASGSNSYNRRAYSKALRNSKYEHFFFPKPQPSSLLFYTETVLQSTNSGQTPITSPSEPKSDNVQPTLVSASSVHISHSQQAKSHAAIITRG
jgi:hypothetical protein